MEILTAPAQALVDTVCLLLERWPMAGQWYMALSALYSRLWRF